MTAFLEGARTGPHGLLVEGPPGIGKTELWRECCSRAAKSGFQVLIARPVEVEATLSFSALSDLLEEVLDPILPSLPPPQRRALEIAALRREDGKPVDARAVGMGLFSALRLLALSAPVLIAVDDAHWLDAASKTVVDYALRRLRLQPVAVLVTRREDPAAADVQLVSALRPEAHGTTIQLGPLSLGAVHKLLRERVREDLHRYAVLRIYEASGGNPMLALEIASLLERQGTQPTPGHELPVPQSLHDLLRRRLAGVSTSTLRVLEMAALLAQPRASLLRRAAPRTAEPALEEATRSGLVRISDSRVEFTHPMLRSVVANELDERAAQRLHARLATLVDDPEEQARHRALSVRGEDEQAAAALEAAAQRATARGAAVAAGGLLEQAAAMTPAAQVEDIAHRRLASTAAYFNAGDGRRCRRLLEDLLPTLPSGPLRSEALCRLGLVRSFTDDVAIGVGLLEDAVKEAAGHPRSRVAALLPLAIAKASMIRLDEGCRHLEEAVTLAESIDDQTGAAEAMSMLAFWRFASGDDPYADLLERASRMAAADSEVRLTFGPDFWSSQIIKYTDDVDRARTIVERLRDLAEERGDEESLPILTNELAEIDLATGAWTAGLRLATESAEESEYQGFETYSAMGHALAALLAAHLGLEDLAVASAERGRESAERTGFLPATLFLRWALGFLALSRQDAVGADEQLGDLASMSVAFGIAEPGASTWLLDQAEALVSLGRLPEAETVISAYMDAAERRGRRWCLGAGLRCRAMVMAGRGQMQQALADAQRAVEIADAGKRPFELARALLVMGGLQRRSNQRSASRQTLQGAVELLESIGARRWAQRAREELQRSGVGNARGVLSPTESRVAKLASSGRSNPEIASQLFMSRKTVEANLARAYRKLGIENRFQLAAALGADGITSDEDLGSKR